MVGSTWDALIYFHFILDLRVASAERNFITSALVKCLVHAMMKPTLWSVAGNYFSYEVRASFSTVSLTSRTGFLLDAFPVSSPNHRRKIVHTWSTNMLHWLASLRVNIGDHFFFSKDFSILPQLSGQRRCICARKVKYVYNVASHQRRFYVEITMIERRVFTF